MDYSTNMIYDLQKYSSSDVVDNIYQEPLKAKNLDVYLTTIKAMKPKAILVGTSPVFHGGRKTGIPFTDEYYVSNEDVSLLQQKDELGYAIINDDEETNKPKKERVSGILWTGLENEMEHILLWNIFPFYAHEKGNYPMRRNITEKEGEEGFHFLELILKEFPSIQIILTTDDIVASIIRKHKELVKQYQIFHVGHPNHMAKDKFIGRIKKAVDFKQNILATEELKEEEQIMYEYRRRWAYTDTKGNFYCRSLNKILPSSMSEYCKICPCNLGEDLYCGYYDFYQKYEETDLLSVKKRYDMLIQANLIPLFPDYKIRVQKAALLIEQAFQFAAEVYRDRICLDTNTPYILHLMEIYHSLVPYITQLKVDNPEEILVAVIFYNILHNTRVSTGKIAMEFGDYTLSLLDESHEEHSKNLSEITKQLREMKIPQREMALFRKIFRIDYIQN